MIFYKLTTAFRRLIQGVLWTAAAFALFGVFRNTPWNISFRQQGIATVGLSILVGLCVVFLLATSKTNERTGDGFFRSLTPRHRVFLLPALFLGVLLPPFWFFVYFMFLVLLLVLVECVHRFQHSGNSVPKEPETKAVLRSSLRTIFQKISYIFSSCFSLISRKMLKKVKTNSPTISATETEIELEEDENDLDEDTFDENTLSQVVRTRTEENRERLEGTFCVEFLPDQWTTTIHVPFCPAFDTPPHVEAFVLDEEDVKLTIFEPKTFGVRIDVKKRSRETSRLHIAITAEERMENGE